MALPKKGQKGFKHLITAIHPVLSSAEDIINDQLRQQQQQPQENQDRGKIGRTYVFIVFKFIYHRYIPSLVHIRIDRLSV
jgi:hypothetical protein